MSGCPWVNRPSLGTSHDAANAGTVLMVSVLRPRAASRIRSELSIWSNAVSSPGCTRAPASVNAIRWRPRTNKGKPTRSSSSRICWLTAPEVTPRAAAARLMLPWRPTSVNARRASSGKTGFII